MSFNFSYIFLSVFLYLRNFRDPLDCNTRLPFTHVSISAYFSGTYDAIGFRFSSTVNPVVMLSFLSLPMRSFGTFISLSASVNGDHPRGLKVFDR